MEKAFLTACIMSSNIKKINIPYVIPKTSTFNKIKGSKTSNKRILLTIVT